MYYDEFVMTLSVNGSGCVHSYFILQLLEVYFAARTLHPIAATSTLIADVQCHMQQHCCYVTTSVVMFFTDVGCKFNALLCLPLSHNYFMFVINRCQFLYIIYVVVDEA